MRDLFLELIDGAEFDDELISRIIRRKSSRIFGGTEVNDVVNQMRCKRGGKDHRLALSAELISADKRQALTIRRLDKVVYDRRVIWRDERG